MIRIEWDGTLETGDPMVDGQHKELIDMFNQLYEHSRAGGDDKSAVNELLVRLSSYVSTHFAAEQALMARTQYPPAEVMTHVREHLELSDRTRELVVEYSKGSLLTILPLASLLQTWLADHIRKRDRAFVQHVQAFALT